MFYIAILTIQNHTVIYLFNDSFNDFASLWLVSVWLQSVGPKYAVLLSMELIKPPYVYEYNYYSTITRRVTVHEVLATVKVGKLNFKVKKIILGTRMEFNLINIVSDVTDVVSVVSAWEIIFFFKKFGKSDRNKKLIL